ncbi:MAG: NAD-dependent dehydratase [Rubellimicrobium sp.]|nr:NAD-dependent dehydratase [Rubellimicrobium sp.]
MSVAVVSGTGFLGRAVMRHLAGMQVPAVAIARGVTTPAGVPFARADRMDTDALRAIFRARRVTAVVDIYALGLRNAAPVIEAAAHQGARYVLVSSTDVYANYEGLLRKGTPPVRHAPATEESPLRVMRYPYRGNPNRPQGVGADLFDDYDKLPVEEALRADTRLPHAILRPPMIFGPGDPQNRFGWAIEAARAGGPVALDARAAGWLNSYAFVDDVAAALALLALHPGAEGRTYNVALPDQHPQRWWLQAILRHLGSDAAVTEVAPDANGLQAGRAEAMDLRYPLTLDSTRIRRELGYAEALTPDEALARTLAAVVAG